MFQQNYSGVTLINATANSTNGKNTTPILHPIPPFDTEAFKIAMLVFYSAMFIVGVPGNLMVLLTIIRVPKMRSVKNIFIANLALGDLVNISWCLPTSLVTLYISWPYGSTACKYIFPVADVIIGNTALTMVLVALDRYRAIVRPFTQKPTLKKAIITIVLLWIFCYVAMGVPLTFALKVSPGYAGRQNCNVHWKSKAQEMSYRFTTFICLFVVPCFVILFSFVRIKNRLEENIRFAKVSLKGRKKLQRAERNKKLIRMFLTIFLCFTMCFLPANILILTLMFHPELASWQYASIAFQLAVGLLVLNSSMNPVILFFLSRDYRRGYLQQVRCFCPSSQNIENAVGVIRRLSTLSLRMRSDISSLNSVPVTPPSERTDVHTCRNNLKVAECQYESDACQQMKEKNVS